MATRNSRRRSKNPVIDLESSGDELTKKLVAKKPVAKKPAATTKLVAKTKLMAQKKPVALTKPAAKTKLVAKKKPVANKTSLT